MDIPDHPDAYQYDTPDHHDLPDRYKDDCIHHHLSGFPLEDIPDHLDLHDGNYDV